MDTRTDLDAEAVESYLKLLLGFRALPEGKRSQTFMEISGYPHYENVCSNILAFYFDPSGEHGMKDLLVCAFLRMAGIDENPSFGKVALHPQRCTEKGNFIDLIVDSETFTIGIENKIYHPLANDLEDYAETIDRMANNKKIVVKAVLGLHPIQDKQSLKGGFVSYTYGQLWRQLRTLLGYYIPEANPKWVTYLLDFMQTTTNLAGENMELKKTDQFFIEYDEEIQKLLAERNAFLNRLYQKVERLEVLMRETNEYKLVNSLKIWGRDTLVLDFYFAGICKISFDLVLVPSGWELQLFSRDKKSSAAYLAKLMKQPPLNARVAKSEVKNERFIVQKWKLGDDLGEIQKALCSWINDVADSAKRV